MQTLLTAPLVQQRGQPALTISRAGPVKRGSSDVCNRPGVVLSTNAYDAASSTSQELSAWHPRLRSADAEILASRGKIVARSRDLYRNSGWAQGGIDKRVDAVVGPRIWLRAKPDFAAMGQTAEWAADWARKAESMFRLWGSSVRFLCDVERHHHFGGLVRLAYYHYILDGEACAAVYFKERGGILATCIQIIDPDRLCNPDGKPDDEHLRDGVVLDDDGAAIGYWIRNAHVGDVGITNWDAYKWTYFPRESPSGRAMFIHVYDKKRAHQRRAVGRLSAVMGRMKMLDRYDQTELQAAVTNAVFGLYAKTQRGTDAMIQSMAPVGDEGDELEALESFRAGWYDKADIRFDGVRVAVLPDGDELSTISATRPATNFVAFERGVLNSVAAALGLSGEQLSNEWNGINYSNARTLLNEIWRGLLSDRHMFTGSLCAPVYAAVLEESIARDLLEVPGGKAMFYVFRDALCQGEWVGPGRGYIDPKKEIDAATGRISSYISNLPDEAAEQGNDWEDNLWNAKRVEEEKKKYGLTQEQQMQGGDGTGGAGGGSDGADATDNVDRQEAAGATR
jgi:lambda family phage portal protein